MKIGELCQFFCVIWKDATKEACCFFLYTLSKNHHPHLTLLLIFDIIPLFH